MSISVYGFLATYGDLGWGRQKAEVGSQKDIIDLPDNFTPSNI